MAPKKNRVDLEESLQHIADAAEAIKRLLIFSLIRDGASQNEIANALGVNQSSISRLLSKPTGAKKMK